MFKKSERLSRQEIVNLMKLGHRIHSEHMVMMWLHGDTVRGTVVVSKKVAKTAVLRNRTKRRIRAVLARILNAKLIKAHVVVVAKAGAPSCSSKQLFDEFVPLIARL